MMQKKIKAVTFKINVPFINCILKISGIKIDNAEDLDVVIPMYNLIEYSKNYRKTTGSLWYYYRDEPSDPLSSNLNPLNIKQALLEILIILVKKLQLKMVMKLILLNMMQIKFVKMKLKLLFL